MIFKDKWGNKHVLNNNYDNKEVIVPSTQTETFQDMTPINLLSRNSSMMNRSSTRVDEARAVTIQNIEPTHNTFGELIRRRKKTNW